MSYQQPTYRLKVGDFMKKMDAERYFSKLRSIFTTAQLQPDKVDVRRGLLIK
ncbi:MAG: SPOR domain-containing protein, partial [Cytophagaceae bacterium]